MHFNLIRGDLGCSPVVCGDDKTVANSISPFYFLSLLWGRIPLPFSFSLPFLILIGSCVQAVRHSARIKCYSQLFAMAQIHSLPWAGIQLQDRCFTVLFIGFSTQRVVLHIDWEQVARRKGKKKKKNPHHVFVIFLTVYGFLWHTDCSWMCKKAGLEVSMRLPSHHSHKNNDALGLVFFSELGVAHAMAHGQAWPAHFPFSSPVSCYSLGKLWTVWVTLEVCHVRSQKLLENHLRATKMHPTLTMYLCLAV